ncbi:lipase 3-like [Lutzomyia longipalpis]|uniref:lipase 3-like n=1 Tax=Lutzomyia longipalpis TaxID=7200 RepID=UPI0024846CD2|nr:lipase 3-like [Lutzomyia longipalpis]
MKLSFILVLIGGVLGVACDDILEDSRLTTTELLRKYGYPAETHIVTTNDGYMLELHRIPNPGGQVAFLMHGMLSSSADWILMGPNVGLGYMLHDLGYDVWMGNARGNRYSRRHTNLNPNLSAFWAFSWHEIGVSDLPANIDYIVQHTGRSQIHYIGHSQGTTVFWVMASEVPQYNSRILSMQALAPAAYMHHTRSPYVNGLVMWLTSTTMALQVMGVHDFAPTDQMNRVGGQDQCRDGAPTQSMCYNEIFLLAGYNSAELNTTMLPVINGHSPAGASTRQMIHFGQVTRHRIFRQYDHGPAMNQIIYGQLVPPLYNLHLISSPVFLYHSFNDWLAAPEDVDLLHRRLPNVRVKHLVSMMEFNHLDFVWAINQRTLLHEHVIRNMRAMEN